MSQLNLHTNPQFDRQLQQYMQIIGVHTKAEAVRKAVQESLEHHLAHSTVTNFKNWVGQALMPTPRKPRFKNDDELWDAK
jgi:hypothetical protein